MPKTAKWNEAPCPACKEPCSVDALKCPHCQTEFTAKQIKERKKSFQSGLVGCGVFGLVLVLLLSMCGGPDSETTDPAISQTAEATDLPPASKEQIEIAMKNFYGRTINAFEPCDKANSALSEEFVRISKGQGTVYEGYAAAKAAETGCEQTSGVLKLIHPPTALPAKAQDHARQALSICSQTAISKRVAAATAQEIFDGDMRPSKIEDFKRQSETAQTAQMACVSALFGTALDAGVKTEDLSKVTTSSKP